MDKINQTLLENHLAFLRSHRGSVRRERSLTFIESDRPEFTYAILGLDARLDDAPASAGTLQILPWSGLSPADLERAGFAPLVGFSYMVLGDRLPDWRVRNDLTIETAGDRAGMDVFSDIQSRGFNETKESFDRWAPWLTAANHRNLGRPDQAFYVARMNGEPAGTALVVHDGATAGIYAVATLPEHRKKGISATIMQRAIRDARARGAETITLQVKQDSYVEDFYRNLGFQRIFTTGFYRRNP